MIKMRVLSAVAMFFFLAALYCVSECQTEQSADPPPSTSGCDAGCLDAEQAAGVWPPEGFLEDEAAVRCALRCLQEEQASGVVR